jgi:serine/threonine protein kinase
VSQCAACGSEAGDVARYCPACGATVHRLPTADPMVGRILAGKFRIEALLGEGGMGMVYKATQINLDKTIVLKVLRPSLISDERTVQRFQREARAASRLNHPNSIGVIDFGQAPEDGSMFIAMEYCPGHDLHHILSNEWPLEESRILRMASQVLGALVEAHANGVIHRDLKPENIMVEQRRGDPDFVKVLDFGIAKITDTTGEEGQALTRAGFVCGTPEYMSPEQARGAVIDHRSDLYAVGVILYQLITGMLPFDSESAVGFATAHLTQEVPAIRKRRPEARCSSGLDRLVMRALAKDPAARPQSAELFRAELLSLAPGGAASTESTAPIAAPLASENTQVTRAWNDKTPANTEAKPRSGPVGGVNSRGRLPAARVVDSTTLEQSVATRSSAMGTSPLASAAPPSSAPRIAIGVTAVGLLIASGFFVWELYLKKPPPPLTVIEPVSVVEPVPPPKIAEPPRPPPHPETVATAVTTPGNHPPIGEEDLTKTVNGSPGKANERLKKSREAQQRADFKSAYALAGEAYELDPHNKDAVLNYAIVADHLGATENNPGYRSRALELVSKLLSRPDLAPQDRRWATKKLKELSDGH